MKTHNASPRKKGVREVREVKKELKTEKMISKLEREMNEQIENREDRQVFSGKHFDKDPVSFKEYIFAYGEYLRRSNKIRG